MEKIQIRLTGKTGKIDGYAETILGIFFMTGMLRQHKIGKKVRAGGITQIYIDLEVRPVPLGHLGEADLPEYEGGEE